MDDEQQHRADSVRRAGWHAGPSRKQKRHASELIDELLAEADGADGAVGATPPRTTFASVRTGRASPSAARPRHGRLLRRDDAAQAAGDGQRPGGAAASPSSPTTRPRSSSIEKAIMESDVGLTPSNDGKMIRLLDPGAQRGAPARAGQGRPRPGRGGPHRGAQRAPRHHARPQASSRTTAMSARDDERRGEQEAAEAHRRAHRRDRRAAQGQGRRNPRGLSDDDAGGGAGGPVRRHHHRWQRALGAAARPAGRRGTQGRCRRGQGAAARRRRVRHPAS